MKNRHASRSNSTRVRWSLFLTLALVMSAMSITTTAGAQSGPRFPTAATTGLTNAAILAQHDGDMTITEDGAIVENLEIHGTLTIQADNVIVRNVWIYTSGFWTIYVSGGSATVENVEIGHPNYPGQRGIGGGRVTGRRLDIHHVEDGIKAGSNSTYDWVYVHDLDSPNSSPHSDGVQFDGGQRNFTIRNSVLDARGGNAAAQIETSLGSIDNALLDNVYLNGGNYQVFHRNGGHGNPTNVTIRNSVFGPDYRYGRLSVDGQLTLSGNTNDDGDPVGGGGGGGDDNYSGQFRDDDNSGYEDAIEAIYNAGITLGCNASGDRFCPYSVVTRAEMAVFLVRALGENPDSAGSPFADVPSNAWFAGYTTQLYGMNLVTGCTASPLNYCPTRGLQRGEMAALLIRALGEEPAGGSSPFADVPTSMWFVGHVKRLYELGITTGCATGPLRFCPGGTLTRGEMAQFLVRAFDL
ncbi:MAG TPA: S-layer homology domain-containing protein [Acidimicrobiia bacterium]|jgi:hypothetical protein